MADYFSVVHDAVAKLGPSTAEMRGDIYEQARNALLDRLQTVEPRLPKPVIDAELAALNKAIARLEAQSSGAGGGIGASSRGRMNRLHIAVLAAIGIAIVAVSGAAVYWLRSGRGVEKSHTVRPNINYIYLRQPVYYRTTHPVGTILIDKAQRFLYVVLPNVVALRYGIGVGPECATAAGLYRISRKDEWPGSDRFSGGRADNPLGPRALYLDTDYRLHGTNAPLTIGGAVPLGCFALFNEDVTELYDRAPLQTRVVVMD